jgi:uncharacterized membrane protein
MTIEQELKEIKERNKESVACFFGGIAFLVFVVVFWLFVYGLFTAIK